MIQRDVTKRQSQEWWIGETKYVRRTLRGNYDVDKSYGLTRDELKNLERVIQTILAEPEPYIEPHATIS